MSEAVPTTTQYTVPGPFKVKVAEGAEVDRVSAVEVQCRCEPPACPSFVAPDDTLLTGLCLVMACVISFVAGRAHERNTLS